MQIGIRKTMSMISISAMPSMPSAQRDPAAERDVSTNCHCAPAGSKRAHSQMPSARSIRVAISAVQARPFALTNRHDEPRDQRDGDQDGQERQTAH